MNEVNKITKQHKKGEIPENVLINLLEDTNRTKKELEKALKKAEEATKAKSDAAAAAAAAAETERTKSQEIRAIIAAMPTSLIVITPDAIIKTVNQATLDCLGYQEKEIIGKSIEILFRENAAAAAAAANILKAVGLGEIIDTGIVKNIEKECRNQKGEKFPMSISGASIKNEKGKIMSIVLIAQDLREIRRLEKERTEALEKAKAELEVLVQQRTQELEKAKASLEIQVEERTGQLQDKLLELERFNKVAVGRELKMVELKEEIARLKAIKQ